MPDGTRFKEARMKIRYCLIALALLILSVYLCLTQFVAAEEWQLFVAGLKNDSYDHIYEQIALTPLSKKSTVELIRHVDKSSSLRLRRVAAISVSRLEIDAENEKEMTRLLQIDDTELQVAAAMRAIVFWEHVSPELKGAVRALMLRDDVIRATITLVEEDREVLAANSLDTSPLVRAAVARRIGKRMALDGRCETELRPILFRLLADHDRLVRSTAVDALCYANQPLGEFAPLCEGVAMDVREHVLLDDVLLPDGDEKLQSAYLPEFYRTHFAAQSAAGLCILQVAPYLGLPPEYELLQFTQEPQLIGKRALSVLLVRNGELGKAFLLKLKNAPDPRSERKRLFD